MGQAANPQAIWDRVHFLGVELDLCNLRQVKEVAKQMRTGVIGGGDISESTGKIVGKRPGYKIDRLDVLVCNAGIGGWCGLNWPLAIKTCLLDTVHATTWPEYKLADVGKRAKLQSSNGAREQTVNGEGEKTTEADEPVLGDVFCANVFGHYVFAHDLMPLLSTKRPTEYKSARITWISSIEAQRENFSLDDLQGMESLVPYESSKRLIDIIALTDGLPSVSRTASSFFDLDVIPKDERESLGPTVKPKLYLTHPGVCATEIVPLNFILAWGMTIAFYLARLLGSPWHTVQSYVGAIAPVWVALAPEKQLNAMESDGRKGKWGSSADAWGEARVRRTEVGGWGWDGLVEGQVSESETRRGRKRGAKMLDREGREEFEIVGQKAWKEMEELRKEWDRRLV